RRTRRLVHACARCVIFQAPSCASGGTACTSAARSGAASSASTIIAIVESQMPLARLPCDVMLAWVDSHPKRGRMHRFNLKNVLFAAVMLSSPVALAGDAKTDAKKPAAAD